MNVLTLERLWGVNLKPLWFFQKCILQRKGEALLFCDFYTFFLKISLEFLMLYKRREDFLLLDELISSFFGFFDVFLFQELIYQHIKASAYKR